MSAKTPYIGSKISLISKAEIRYEGVLYAVDTKEATVTLAKVRSFGTEDRQVPKPIPPRTETYEFIIFRGSDIKDLHVSEIPKTDEAPQEDPAIVSATSQPPVSLPTSDPQPPLSSQPLPPLPSQPPTYSPFAPTPGGFSPFYFKPQVMMGGAGPGTLPRPPHIPPPPTAQQSVHPLPLSSHQPFPPFIQGQLPIPISQKSPFAAPNLPPTTTAAPVISTIMRPSPGTMTENKGQGPVASSTPQTEAGLAAKPQSTVGGNTPAQTTPQAANESESPLARMNPVSPASQVTQAPPPSLLSHVTPPLDPTPVLAPQQITNVNDPKPPLTSSNGPPDGPQNEKQMLPMTSNGKAPLISEPPSVPFSDHSHSDRRTGNNPSNGSQSDRGRGRGRKNYRVRGRVGSSNQQEPTYRYENDFDFESANAQFDKQVLEEEFGKLRVSRSRPSSEDGAGGVTDEQQETGEEEREDEVLEEGEVVDLAEPGEFYDKSKSFFDSISCETRGSSRSHRTNWNEERELNTETFGVSSVNHFRRGWGQGRWRGRGRGRGGGSRGRGYYRGGRGGRRDEGRDRESREDRPPRGGRRGGSGYYYQRNSGGYHGRERRGRGGEKGGRATDEQSQRQPMTIRGEQ